MLAWRVLQVGVWALGAAIVAALVLAPQVGLHALWNVLVPVAPALLALAPGLWRNVCPLGSTAMALHHAGLSGRRKLPAAWQPRFLFVGVCLLFLIVPLRHVVLNADGPASALALGAVALVAVTMGLVFESKSGWCSGICPVQPVEKLYGSSPLVSVPNAHCGSCRMCVPSCPESVASNGREVAWFAAMFPGFVWGWFQTPDYRGGEGWAHLDAIYGYPLAGAAVTLALFAAVLPFVPKLRRRALVRVFAAAAIGLYYWYRIPMLFDMGAFPGDGVLVDLRGVLPGWFVEASRIATVALVGAWLIGGHRVRRPWTTRPPVVESLRPLQQSVEV